MATENANKEKKQLPEVKKGQVVIFTYLKSFGVKKKGDSVKMEGTTAKALLDSYPEIGEYKHSIVGQKKDDNDELQDVLQFSCYIRGTI